MLITISFYMSVEFIRVERSLRQHSHTRQFPWEIPIIMIFMKVRSRRVICHQTIQIISYMILVKIIRNGGSIRLIRCMICMIILRRRIVQKSAMNLSQNKLISKATTRGILIKAKMFQIANLGWHMGNIKETSRLLLDNFLIRVKFLSRL